MGFGAFNDIEWNAIPFNDEASGVTPPTAIVCGSATAIWQQSITATARFEVEVTAVAEWQIEIDAEVPDC